MRQIWAVIPIALVASCGSEIAPNTGGVGFGDYDSYLEQRDAQAEARSQSMQPGMVVSPESSAPTASNVASAPSIPDPATAVVEPAPAVPVVDTLTTSSLEQPLDPNNPNISDEQNFDAVSSRESIESDKERLDQQRGQFKVIEPTALPKRRGGSGPNIVAFALETTNGVGEQRYNRGPFKNATTTARNCRRYISADLAQEAFLAAGGPKRDPKKLDPDGDGFACEWDPTPFRRIRN